MTWWDKLKKTMASEAEDAKDELEKLRDVVDKELTRKERELEATPAERIDMILEDIETDHGRLEEIERSLGDERTTAERVQESSDPTPAPSAEPDPPPESAAPARRAKLLGPADVPPSPHLPEALEWVSVALVDPRTGDVAPPGFDHEVRIEPEAPVEARGLAESLAAASTHPLILDVVEVEDRIGFVNAPGLASDDVRLVVASALAARIPAEGKE